MPPSFLRKGSVNMTDSDKQLCPVCKTGRDMKRLDPKEPVCPFMCMHDGKRCVKFVRLKELLALRKCVGYHARF